MAVILQWQGIYGIRFEKDDALGQVCERKLKERDALNQFWISSKRERESGTRTARGFKFFYYSDLCDIAQTCECSVAELFDEAGVNTTQMIKKSDGSLLPDGKLLAALDQLSDKILHTILGFISMLTNCWWDIRDEQGNVTASPTSRAWITFNLRAPDEGREKFSKKMQEVPYGDDPVINLQKKMAEKYNLALATFSFSELCLIPQLFDVSFRWLFVMPDHYSFYGYKPLAEQVYDQLKLLNDQTRNILLRSLNLDLAKKEG